MDMWYKKRPCVLPFEFNGEEYEVQDCTDKYAVFQREGLYSWKQCTNEFKTPMDCFLDFMSNYYAEEANI